MIFSVLLLQNFMEPDVWGNLHWCSQVWSFILGFRLRLPLAPLRWELYFGLAMPFNFWSSCFQHPEVSGVHQHAWFMWYWASNLRFFIVMVRAVASQPHPNPPQHLKKKLPLQHSASLRNCWPQLGASRKSGCSNVKKQKTKTNEGLILLIVFLWHLGKSTLTQLQS